MTSLTNAENNAENEAVMMVKLMPSSNDYFESLKAQLERDGYVVVEKELVKSKEVC